MNMKRNSVRRSTSLSVVLVLLSVLLLSCGMVLAASAEGETYTLNLQVNMYDDLGEEGLVGIKAELQPGTPIVIEDLIARYPTLQEALADYVLDADSIVGMPADGLMPAENLSVSVLYKTTPFTISWVVDGQTVATQKVSYGETPVYGGETPVKAPDAQYTYTFKSWDAEAAPAYGDVTYTALFDTTVNEYTVTWIVDGNTTTETYKYGETPVFAGSTDKAATAEFTYTFAGWDKEIVAVEGDVTYTAQYTETRNKYTVTWIVDGNTTTEQVEYGQVPVFAGSTDKAATAEFTYTFAGWDKEIVAVEGDVTYTAQYTETRNKYTVTWIVDGNTTTEQVEYGEVPAFKGSTDKASDDQYSYTFKGWDKEIVAVVGDATYTAQYDKVLGTVTITFKVPGQADVVLTVKVGDVPEYPNGTPVKEADAQYTYTFGGWDAAVTPADEDTVYTATFIPTIRKYKVTFKYGHNKILPLIVEYGQSVTAPTNTDKAPTATTVFEFTGWDADFSNITGDLVVNAVYTETDRLYTVTFNYGDGKTQSVQVKYGESATAPTDTDKAATETVTYTFKGWDVDFAEVTADLTVNAVYEETPIVVPPTVDTSALQAVIDAYKAAGLDVNAEVLTKAEAALNDGTLTQEQIDALAADLQAAIDSAEPGSETETDTDPVEPGTEDPTDKPEDPTDKPEDPTEEPTAEPGSESETDEPKPVGCENSWIWIVIVILVVGAAAAVVIILIRRKNGSDPEPPAASETESEAEPEAEPEVEPEATVEPAAPAAPELPLFIPLGEAVPEEEPVNIEDIETVEEVSAETVDELMTDKTAEKLLEETDEEGGSGKQGIINVGVISAAYQAGDVVDLASLQEKGMIDANVGRLKVLASGTLDKPLTIKADAFSVQAIKMITLTGGHAIHLNGK